MNITIEDDVDGGTINDTSLFGDADINYGVSSNLQVYDYPNTTTRAAFIIYTDLSALSGVIVDSAQYKIKIKDAGTCNCEMRALLRTWNQGNKDGQTASTGEATPLSARHNEEAWTTVLAGDNGTDYSGVHSSFLGPDSTGWFAIDLNSSIIQDRIDSPSKNKGDICTPTTFSSSLTWIAYSTENLVNQPQFYIEYTEDPYVAVFDDISKKDKSILSKSDNISYVAPEAVDADTRYEVASEKVEEESNINHYLSQYEKIIETSDQVAEILDERCKGYTFKFDPAKMPALTQAIRKVFGKDSAEITYDMYKQVLEEQMTLNEKIGDEIFAQ